MSHVTLSSIDLQLQAWIKEGYSGEDILAQAHHNWPHLSEADIQAKLKRLSPNLVQDKSSGPGLLELIHAKRMKEIERLEQRLDDEACPLAVHTLYRGLLRDVESQCFKTLAHERQLMIDADKQSAANTRQQFRLDLAQAKRHDQWMKQMGSHEPLDDEDEEELNQTSTTHQGAGKSFTSFSTLLGIIFAVLLASYACVKLPVSNHAQPPATSTALSTPDLTHHSQRSSFPSHHDSTVVQSQHRKLNLREKENRC